MGEKIVIIRISLEFKFDATYRVDVLTGLLDAVSTVVSMVMKVLGAFESLKGIAQKYMGKLLGMCCELTHGIDRVIEKVGEKMVKVLTSDLPKLVYNATQMLDRILAVVNDAGEAVAIHQRTTSPPPPIFPPPTHLPTTHPSAQSSPLCPPPLHPPATRPTASSSLSTTIPLPDREHHICKRCVWPFARGRT